jgi:hypothetical protein
MFHLFLNADAIFFVRSCVGRVRNSDARFFVSRRTFLVGNILVDLLAFLLVDLSAGLFIGRLVFGFVDGGTSLFVGGLAHILVDLVVDDFAFRGVSPVPLRVGSCCHDAQCQDYNLKRRNYGF